MKKNTMSILSLIVASALLMGNISSVMALTSTSNSSKVSVISSNSSSHTTPIKHIVVLFQENVSFDHYFGTYPHATNIKGEPQFKADPYTPSVNGLVSAGLLTNNPNSVNPFRLDHTQAVTCDMNHEYTAEQQAYNGGLLNKFVEFAGPTDPANCTDLPHKQQVMDYYDGNIVTALWNYAQHYAMSDNFFNTLFGPSTPAVFNLIAGQTHGALPINQNNDEGKPSGVVNGTVIGDADPKYDDCGKAPQIAMTGKNVGDLLNQKGITWGWFQGGFKPSSIGPDGKAVCNSQHKNINGTMQQDYNPHHAAFQYYNSTSNPHHLPPSSVTMIGKTDQANHQYDLNDFWSSAQDGNLPAVSFIKAPKYQNGHPAYSNPLDEQTFLVNTINNIQKLPEWNSTAIVITYDDSDGWYDHVMPPIISQSSDPKNDKLLGANGLCGQVAKGIYQDRCGYGPRAPLLIISPYSKSNFVDHSITDQTSILRFIEDNWNLGRIEDQSFDEKAGSLMNMFDFTNGVQIANKLILDPSTGLNSSSQ